MEWHIPASTDENAKCFLIYENLGYFIRLSSLFPEIPTDTNISPASSGTAVHRNAIQQSLKIYKCFLRLR